MFAAIAAGIPSPLKSSHILWINLITDSLPALALGVDKNDGSLLMKKPPRKPGESVCRRRMVLYGILRTADSSNQPCGIFPCTLGSGDRKRS